MSSRARGFTLLECMIALLLVATALVILVESQWFAVEASERALRRDTATMLARDIMTDLELRMAKEGFGELEVKEQGDFAEDHFAGSFPDYRWEYEVEKVELDELPNLSMLLGLAGEGTEEAGQELGVPAAEGGGPGAELDMLQGLGFDFSIFGEMMGAYLREARVRVCYPDGLDERGGEVQDCVELISHLTNPTGQVATAEEQEALEEQESPTPERTR